MISAASTSSRPPEGRKPDSGESDADGNAGDGGEAEVSDLSEYRQLLIERQQAEAGEGGV